MRFCIVILLTVLSVKASSQTWWDSNKQYLRVETNDERIYSVSISDIAKLKPVWKGIEARHLRLLHNGNQVRFYVNTSSTVEESDTSSLYFVGSRPKGDTSWLDSYSNVETFFITVDSTSVPLRYSLSKQELIGPLVEQIEISEHIEKDSIYVVSDLSPFIAHESTIFQTEQVPGEGWYYGLFQTDASFSESPDFTTLNWYEPVEGSAKPLTLRRNFRSITQDTAFPGKDHDVSFHINGIQQARSLFGGIGNRTFEAKIPTDGILHNVTIRSELQFKFYDATTKRYCFSKEAVDFDSLYGFAKTHSVHGVVRGNVHATQISQLRAYGLQSTNVAKINSTTNELEFCSVAPGALVRVNASRTQKFNYVAIGDSLIQKSDTAVAVLAILNSQTKEIVKLTGKTTNELPQLNLQAFAEGTIVVLSTNDTVAVNSSLAFQLSNLFGISVQKSDREATIFIGVVGNPALTFTAKSELVVSTSKWLEIPNGNSYSAKGLVPVGVSNVVINTPVKCTLRNVESSSLSSLNNRADYLVISHSSFIKQAQRLAEYRQSTGFVPKVIDVDWIYNEFGSGKKSPHAIQKFLKFAYKNWSSPRSAYVVLFGDASWDSRQVSKNSKAFDFVPTYGRPVSDHWYVCVDGDDNFADMSVGRLPVQTAFDAENIVDKIIEYESLEPAPWMKKFTYISAGNFAESPSEVQFFREYVNVGASQLAGAVSCADTITFDKTILSKQSGVSIQSLIRQQINSGTLWVNFGGHGAPYAFEVGGWYANDLNNGNKYSILTTYSCQTGAFAEPEFIALNEEYVTKGKKGFIAAIGSTGYGFSQTDIDIHLYKFIAIAQHGIRRLGDIQKFAKEKLNESNPFDDFVKMTVMQNTLLGDPALQIRLDNKFHPYILSNEIELSDSKNNSSIDVDSDSLIVKTILRSYGTSVSQQVKVRAIVITPDRIDTSIVILPGVCAAENLSFSFKLSSKAGNAKLLLEVDYDSAVAIANREHSRIEVPFYIFDKGLLPVEPLHGWNSLGVSPIVRVIDPLAGKRKARYSFLLRKERDSSLVDSVGYVDQSNLNISETHIDWKINQVLTHGERYILFSSIKDSSDIITTTSLSVTADSSSSNRFNIVSNAKEFLDTDSLELDSSSLLFTMKKKVQFSIKGGAGDSVLNGRFAEINVGDYFFGGQFNRGFNIAVVPFEKNGTIRNARYDNIEDYWKEKGEKDSISKAFLSFLQDSIKQNEYVLITSFDIALEKMRVDSLVDSLTVVLQKFGLSPSFNFNLDTTNKKRAAMSFIGFLGADSSLAKMSIDYNATPAFIEGTLDRYYTKARFRSPIFGVAAKWDSLVVHANFDTSSFQFIHEVFGLSSINSEQELLQRDTNMRSINVSTIDAQAYPYLQLRTEVNRKSYYSEPNISHIQAYFNPKPEIAIVPSSFRIDKNNILQGDTTQVSFSIANLSLRSTVADFAPSLKVIDTKFNTIVDQSSFSTIELPTNSTQQYTFQVVSQSYPLNSNIECTSMLSAINGDMYSFNNNQSIPLTTQRDTLLPDIRVFANGIELDTNSDNLVAQQPFIEMYVDDNARLRIYDTLYLRGRLNGTMLHNSFLQRDYSFYATDSVSKLPNYLLQTRMGSTFVADLTIGDNSLHVYARDAFGNIDTAKYRLRVSNEINVQSDVVFPNPAREFVNFRYKYKGQIQTNTIICEVYNLQGQLVNSMQQTANLGENILSQRLLDSEGNSLPKGVYFYRLYLSFLGNQDATSGTFVIQ